MVPCTIALKAAELGLDVHSGLPALEVSGALEPLGDLDLTGPTQNDVNDRSPSWSEVL